MVQLLYEPLLSTWSVVKAPIKGDELGPVR